MAGVTEVVQIGVHHVMDAVEIVEVVEVDVAGVMVGAEEAVMEAVEVAVDVATAVGAMDAMDAADVMVHVFLAAVHVGVLVLDALVVKDAPRPAILSNDILDHPGLA